MSEFSEKPTLVFVIYADTEDGCVLCVKKERTLILPRYEFQPANRSEANTTGIRRQMREDIGYDTQVGVYLTKREIIHTAAGTEYDQPFRTCIARRCVQCAAEEIQETIAPWVQYAQEPCLTEKFESFEAWSARKKRGEKEKKDVVPVPAAEWTEMIQTKQVMDMMSVVTTQLAREWIAFPKQTK